MKSRMSILVQKFRKTYREVPYIPSSFINNLPQTSILICCREITKVFKIIYIIFVFIARHFSSYLFS